MHQNNIYQDPVPTPRQGRSAMQEGCAQDRSRPRLPGWQKGSPATSGYAPARLPGHIRPWRLTAALIVNLICAAQCSQRAASPRVIRMHTRVLQGIAHADPAATAGRYCVYCHGISLQGGSRFEPSCFTCHGVNWLDPTNDQSRAPADHLIDNKGFMHKQGLFTPDTQCALCHGAGLAGVVSSGAGVPGCELCHTSLWQERSPPAGEF